MHDILNDDVLKTILKSFEKTNDAYFVRLVCKRWSQLVKPFTKRNGLKKVAEYFASLGNTVALEYLHTYYKTFGFDPTPIN